jgi:hypothetical protein
LRWRILLQSDDAEFGDVYHMEGGSETLRL